MKSINFEFLRPKWPELSGLGGFAEAYAHPDPVGSIAKLRVFGEQIVESATFQSGDRFRVSEPAPASVPVSATSDAIKATVLAGTPSSVDDERS